MVKPGPPGGESNVGLSKKIQDSLIGDLRLRSARGCGGYVAWALYDGM